MSTVARWHRSRIEKLEKRIHHHRALGDDLDDRSILKLMNERALLDMEMKLFRLKKQSVSPQYMRVVGKTASTTQMNSLQRG